MSAQLPGSSIGPHQLTQDRVVGVVAGEQTVGQLVRIDPAQIMGIRLWFSFPTGRPSGTLVVRLYSYEHQRDIASANLPIDRIATGGATDIFFTQIDQLNWPADQPLTVELRISAPTVASNQAIALAGGPNRYANGPLIIDGNQDPGQDLTFALLYSGSALDSLLPISHIAAGRTGLLGWSPLYALLAWLMIWCAVALLTTVVWSSRRSTSS